MLTRIAVTLSAALGLGTLATEARAASLAVSVSPVTVHPGSTYTVSIAGSYGKPRQTPYLVAFIQYSGQPCKATATAEYRLPRGTWTFEVFPQAEPKSPFKSVKYWKAGASQGPRRLCVYLYAGQVGPKTTAQPLVSTGAGYSFRDARG